MAKVEITQVRSSIKRPKTQKLTLQSLGLGGINRKVEKDMNPQIEGMIKKVQHLITVKEL